MQLERDLPLETFKPTVQVYAVVDEITGQYELMGHGFLSIITDQFEQGSIHYIEVLKKTEGILMRSRMRIENNFEKQKGTVIVWRDNQQKHHQQLAISFEEEKQSDFFWRLICEKVGKNYLDISGRDVLEMPSQTNLLFILDKTKTAKDMVEYHLLNSRQFITCLHKVFKIFESKSNQMGMGTVGRIMKSILTNMDHRLVENMFSDPSFELILQIERFNKNIDYVKMWKDKMKIKVLFQLSDQIFTKILIIHRISFYRQNILDLMKDTYFEHILVLTETECYKDIINQLTKDTIIDQIVDIKSLPEDQWNQKEDYVHSPQSQALKQKILCQKKVEFMMEAILITKQMQSQNLKQRFLDRIYKSQIMKLTIQMMDLNIAKSIDFFNCLAQANPLKFLEYLKEKFREKPSDNLHLKLAKKYCLGTEQFQQSILQIIKYFADLFKTKEYIDFFIGTFFTYVFQCCKNQKALLALFCEIQNIIDNIESFFMQILKSNVISKILPFLRNLSRDKISQLRALKILKRILLQNAHNRQYKNAFLLQINSEIINSGYFEYCMSLLTKNIQFNNIISSSMLENLKIIRQFKHFTPYHENLQSNYNQVESISKYLELILKIKPEVIEDPDKIKNPDSHLRELQEQRQESYFMDEIIEETAIKTVGSPQETRNQVQQLKRIKQQIMEREKQEENIQMQGLQRLRKLRKENESQTPMCLEFNLSFDQNIEGNE